MALPGSGPLSFSAIAGELGISLSNVSLRSMSLSAGFGSPDAVGDFYGYASLTYSYYATYYAGNPCGGDIWDIYLGSNGVYYTYDGFSYGLMYDYTDIWYEFLYYESKFSQNVYEEWSVNTFSTAIDSNGTVLSFC